MSEPTPVLPESSPVVGQADKNLRVAIMLCVWALSIFTIVSCVGGIVLMTTEEESTTSFITEKENPYVGAGVSVILVALLVAAFGALAINYTKWRVEHATWLDRNDRVR